jgi:membrane peptidoglycan carboxypeptidase
VAKEMTTMLEEVVRVGTGTAANLDPYTVAGKTGTGKMPSPSGGYVNGRYVASFAGFVPAEDPQITGMVVIDNTPDYGAAASAPTFATIARDALFAFNIPPSPKQPPAPGVPLATPASATGAGEIAGTPLPGLSKPPVVATTVTTIPANPARSTPSRPGPSLPAAPSTATTPPTTVAAVRSRSSPPAG